MYIPLITIPSQTITVKQSTKDSKKIQKTTEKQRTTEENIKQLIKHNYTKLIKEKKKIHSR